MKDLKPDMKGKLNRLLMSLSYTRENGWVTAKEFDSIHAHRFALAQASEYMSIVGVFCWLSGQHPTSIAAPLVYIATATDRADAQTIHRKVWSQGLVPFLLVLTPSELIVCDGFRYSREDWNQNVSAFNWTELPSNVIAQRDPSKNVTLSQLAATKLRSSLFWREHAIDVSGRVDQQLLNGLDGLSWSLMQGDCCSKKLKYKAANSLIGKLLYVFFLSDRGVINQNWLEERGHKDINLQDAGSSWSKRSLWKLLDDLDAIFNGSIFPLSVLDRSEIDQTHIDLVRMVIKHGAISKHGIVQLSFIDIDLGVLRVETLSAVYEQFLENVKRGERRRVGAYYTPPFLVDLVLDRVEEARVLEDGVTVLDPAAGSGVFLVGAYRRILENARASTSTTMSLETVRGLLTRNIFGIERNADACHIAAFSLYLTMLDYVNPRDLSRVAMGKDPKKLFPTLVGSNILAQDFFSNAAFSDIPGIHCVVGNPPWQTLKILGSVSAEKWSECHTESPIGNGQAAELFLWKAMQEHMVEDGVLAMLIPAKSFVNPTSARFRQRLIEEYSVIGAINFAHLRHKLFVGAKHACAGIFIRKCKPEYNNTTWVYSPLSVSQPIASRNEWPWTMIMDKSDVQVFQQSFFSENPRAWFEAFILRPVDRQIHHYINDQAKIKTIELLGPLCRSIGAVIKRGGNSNETGLVDKYLSSEGSNTIEIAQSTGQTRDLFQDLSINKSTNKIDKLPLSQLAKVASSYKNQFSGKILLVPRNFRNIRFIDYPKGYTSSYLAVFFNKQGNLVKKEEQSFLRALEKYLNSETALYFVATIGRRWMMDRRNVEPTDLAALPVPFTSISDPRIKAILGCDEDKLETYFLRAMGINGDLKNSIKEFLKFRMFFQDGNVPNVALKVPTQTSRESYLKVLRHCLDELVGRQGAFHVEHQTEQDAGVGIVVAHFADEGSEVNPATLIKICGDTLNNHCALGTNSFTDSLSISYQPETTTVCMTKPLEYFRWTIDSAYTDSRLVMNAFVEG